MKEVLYAKYNSHRKPEYRIATLIVAEDGKKMVTKAPMTEAANRQMDELFSNYDRIKNSYRLVQILPGEKHGNNLIYPFVEGSELLSDIDFANDELSVIVEKVKKDIAPIFDFQPECVGEFTLTKGFEEVFDKRDFPKGTPAVTGVNFDTKYDNYKTDDAGTIWCFDYEWVFDFPVPVEFMRFRTAKYVWVSNSLKLEGRFSYHDFLQAIGFDLEKIAFYDEMEFRFQEYAVGKDNKYAYTNHYRKASKNLDYEISVRDEQIRMANACIVGLEEGINDKDELIYLQQLRLDKFKRAIKNPFYGIYLTGRYIRRCAGRIRKSLSEKFGMCCILVKKTITYYRRFGLKNTILKIKTYKENGNTYELWRLNHIPTKEELERQRNERFDKNPLISVIIPLYKTKEIFLREIIQSLQAQTYGKYEICFSDGSPLDDRDRIRAILEDEQKRDSRIRWIAKSQEPLGISENTNQALSIAKGDYIILGDHDDLYEPDAFYECVKLINKEKDPVDVIYTDEDKVNESGKHYSQPHFKPDFNIDFLRSGNYICHMFVFSRAIYEKIGGFRGEFNGAQDYDIILRAVEQAKRVYHIPKVLYHWRMNETSTAADPASKLYAYESGEKALQEHYDRLGIKAKATRSQNYGYYDTTYEVEETPEIDIVEINDQHHACINENVISSNSEYVLLKDIRCKMPSEDALKDMLGICQREDVAAVSAKVLYPNGTVRDAGIIVGLNGAAEPAYRGLNENDGSIAFLRNKANSDYSAVASTCMIIKRKVFEEIGGFDDELTGVLADTDLCLKAGEKGYLVVFDAAAVVSYEVSMKGDIAGVKEISQEQRELFCRRWDKILREGDPYYNVNYSRELPGFEFG